MADLIRHPLNSLDLDFDPLQDDQEIYLDISEYTSIVDDAVGEALGYSLDDPKWKKFVTSGGERFYFATEDIWGSYCGFFIDNGDFVVDPDQLKSWANKQGDQAREYVEEHWNDSTR